MFNILFFIFIASSVSCVSFRGNDNEIYDATIPEPYSNVNDGVPPYYFDWRDQGMVSPIKNQGTCNACWAFSAIANIESHLKIYLNRSEILSEQFLIDCDPSQIGCGSKSVLKTFSNIVSYFGGVLRDRDYYPYSERMQTCTYKQQPKPVPVIGYKRVKPDEDEMMTYLYKYGPLSAGINSNAMGRYKNGIDEPTEEECSPDEPSMNHAVLIVGYNAYRDPNTGKETPYWIIKNSWGVEWGDKGYYYLIRGRNACGISNDVSFSFVD